MAIAGGMSEGLWVRLPSGVDVGPLTADRVPKTLRGWVRFCRGHELTISLLDAWRWARRQPREPGSFWGDFARGASDARGEVFGRW